MHIECISEVKWQSKKQNLVSEKRYIWKTNDFENYRPLEGNEPNLEPVTIKLKEKYILKYKKHK